ncbi:hypothetical protein ElyMa_005533800 [Elysia marginata]|uniref:Uncharacterized protein n=1 Tax=Elysia marginata TaxID=1093978 RepID=A0AAV4EWT7_9GAST|nr:hypothetical protein ElyMa_005533800 [Elysia marginata]
MTTKLTDNPPNIEPEEVDLEIDLQPPSTEECLGAIKKLRNNKAAEPDGIPGDAIKGSVEFSAKALTGLFQRIWTSEAQLGKEPTGPQSQREAKNDVEERNRGRDGIRTEDMERTGRESTRYDGVEDLC